MAESHAHRLIGALHVTKIACRAPQNAAAKLLIVCCLAAQRAAALVQKRRSQQVPSSPQTAQASSHPTAPPLPACPNQAADEGNRISNYAVDPLLPGRKICQLYYHAHYFRDIIITPMQTSLAVHLGRWTFVPLQPCAADLCSSSSCLCVQCFTPNLE